jgi:hypothetical protein
VLWRMARRGKRSGRTGNSPGTRRWGRLGRRMAGGGKFGGRRARYLRGNPANRRRLWAILVDSSGGEEEDGDGDLLSFSEEQVGARKGGPR